MRVADNCFLQPREFLQKGERNRLRSLLQKHGGDLSKFCDKLDCNASVSDSFADGGVMPDMLTTLVAEVRNVTTVQNKKGVDVSEYSGETLRINM